MKRIIPASFSLISLGLLAACSTLHVESDHDPHADFSKYRTYSWAAKPADENAPDESGVPSPLVEERIRSAVDSQLAGKGLRRVASTEHPDLVVHDRVRQKEKVEGSGGPAMGFVAGGYGPWYGGLSTPTYDLRQYTEGTLVLDLVDSTTHRLVWRGIATDVVGDPAKSEKRIDQAVTKTLQQYPPTASG